MRYSTQLLTKLAGIRPRLRGNDGGELRVSDPFANQILSKSFGEQ